MYREPAVWHALLEKLAETFAAYVLAQARAGADVVQLFDSWVGALSPADYAEFVAPWSARVLAALARRRRARDPLRHGRLDAAARDGRRRRRRDRPRLADPARRRLGARRRTTAPCRGISIRPSLLGPWERIEAGARDVLARADGRPGHIFNLGHGVLPGTDPDVLGRLRELVHATETAHEELTLLAHRRDKGHLAPALPLFLFPRVGGG